MQPIFRRCHQRMLGGVAVLLGAVGLLNPLISHADPSVEQVVEAFLQRQLLTTGGDDMGLMDAYRFQHEYVRATQGRQGPRRGFKVAMTSASSQHHFGLSEPLYGQFQQQMLLHSPATLPVNFGARGLVEADLLVRVADAGINQVTNIDDLLAHIDAVIPFIELPDPLWSTALTAVRLVAVNCGARYGVLGEPIALVGSQEWRHRLRAFEVELQDPSGAVLGSGRGVDLLGDPLNVVMWLVNHLRQRGDTLKPGDLISLGSLTRPLPPEAGRYQAIYQGLDPQGLVSVSVEFVTEQ